MLEEFRLLIGLLALCVAAAVILFWAFKGLTGKSAELLAEHLEIDKQIGDKILALDAEYSHYITYGSRAGFQLTDHGKSADRTTILRLIAKIDAMIDFINDSFQNDDVDPWKLSLPALFEAIGNRRTWVRYQRECKTLARVLLLSRSDVKGEIWKY
jgi:hypothetical protein